MFLLLLQVVNYSESRTAEEICESASKMITFIDLAGHHKYLKTTIFGLTSYCPDFAMLVVSASTGIGECSAFQMLRVWTGPRQVKDTHSSDMTAGLCLCTPPPHLVRSQTSPAEAEHLPNIWYLSLCNRAVFLPALILPVTAGPKNISHAIHSCQRLLWPSEGLLNLKPVEGALSAGMSEECQHCRTSSRPGEL